MKLHLFIVSQTLNKVKQRPKGFSGRYCLKIINFKKILEKTLQSDDFMVEYMATALTKVKCVHQTI